MFLFRFAVDSSDDNETILNGISDGVTSESVLLSEMTSSDEIIEDASFDGVSQQEETGEDAANSESQEKEVDYSIRELVYADGTSYLFDFEKGLLVD